jgi:hypothetical protein
MPCLTEEEETVVALKMAEPRGNVIENKGALWKKSGRSRNVVDYKWDTFWKRESYRKQRRK